MRSRTDSGMPAPSTSAFILAHISPNRLGSRAADMASRWAALSSSATPAAFIDSR
jgi:hypothetical protein